MALRATLTEVRKCLDIQKEKFKRIYGRQPGKGDPIFTTFPSGDHITSHMVGIMAAANIRPELIYAYEKTGLIVTSENINLLPENELDEWDEAIEEYFQRQKDELSNSDIGHFMFLSKMCCLEARMEQLMVLLERFIQKFGEAKNIKLRCDGVHTHHDFIVLCIAKSLKSLKSINLLLSDCYGEDALILTRSLYENYLAIGFLLKNPEKIHDLVTAKVRLRTGDCERVKVKINEKNRRVIRDKLTGQIFPANIEIRSLAEGCLDPDDLKIHEFLYSYLSDYSHPTIFALESYVTGSSFDIYKSDKGFHAGLYGCYVGTVILECIFYFQKLNSSFKRDLHYIVNQSANTLIEIFSKMKGSVGYEYAPELFTQRLTRLLERIAEAKKKRPSRQGAGKG